MASKISRKDLSKISKHIGYLSDLRDKIKRDSDVILSGIDAEKLHDIAQHLFAFRVFMDAVYPAPRKS